MRLTVLFLTFVSYAHCYGEKPIEDFELSRVATDAWNKDPNRLKVGEDILLNWQSQIEGSTGRRDIAPDPLCTIKSKKLLQDPVYKAFVALLDNYEHRVGISERETPEEKKEIERFLDAIVKTETMKAFHSFLVAQKLASASQDAFKEELYDIWFKTYRRITQGDSSPFEHVFIGEAKNDVVLGMHNWITFCIKEKEGIFNYYGKLKPHYSDPDYKASFRFSMYKNFLKPFNTIIFGSSVEFDFGLFTAAFLRLQQLYKNQPNFPPLAVNLDKTKLLIQCHPFARTRMGSCYVK
nr:poly(u) specific endoribonuclease b,poly(u) specific endoribonuclease a,poly(u) specific endoribonuclease [Hymenolepis microstoma]